MNTPGERQAPAGVCLGTIRITRVEPCLADPSEWRLYATPDADISETLPYLNAVLTGARYTHETRTLSFRRQGMLVTVMPREIRLALVPTLDAGRALLEWLRGTINDTYARRASIVPREGLQRLPSALELYKLLPRTNCARCGFGTCIAFALRLASGIGRLGECPLLQEVGFLKPRMALQMLLGEA
ncbi:MAG: Fe-S cluster protein [Armatimonadetes bacterium]|nr:Fe-S cluster protein [Armatimonadota bacterium]